MRHRAGSGRRHAEDWPTPAEAQEAEQQRESLCRSFLAMAAPFAIAYLVLFL